MNDFTKEELVLLACWSVARYEQQGSKQANDEGTISLSHKIQSMMDNYCEHDWVFVISPNGNTVRCTKCNKGIPE